MHLGHVAEELQHRLQHLFVRDDSGRRAVNDGNDTLDFDPHWKDYLWFYEFFDGDTGRGLGATHQCGWSGLIAKMIHDTGINCRLPQTPRTPSTAAAHYFDDIMGRGGNKSRKNSIPSTPRLGRMRRSSTSRSLSNAPATPHPMYMDSSRGSNANEDHHGFGYFESSNPANSAVSDGRDSNNAFGDEERLERERRRSVADEHVEKYVAQQLSKINTEESVAVYEDEFEAQLD